MKLPAVFIAIIENVISIFLKRKIWLGIHLKIAEFKKQKLYIQTEKEFIFANLTFGWLCLSAKF